MFSSGTIVAITPLLPCLPAILSPIEIFLLLATYTFASFRIPGCNWSPSFSLKMSVSNLSSNSFKCLWNESKINLILSQDLGPEIQGSSIENCSKLKVLIFFKLNFVPFLTSTLSFLSFIPREDLSFRIPLNNLSLDALNSLSLFLLSFWSSLIALFTSALDCLDVFSYKSVLITTPFTPGSAFLEASFTSPAFSPNIARKSFSSGDGSVSPLGVTLPIRISSSFTIAPTRINPFSSNWAVASSLTFGISGVNSSWPLFVSLTSSSISLTWIEVKTSSLTSLSLITMASSKL